MSKPPTGATAALRRRLTPEPERPPPQDPVAWVRSELDEHLWSVQRQIIRAVKQYRRVAVPSAHGTGKSRVASRVIAEHISQHPPGEAFAVSTAPSGSQVKAILWRELASAHRRGGLPGQLTIPKADSGVPTWHIGDELVAFGRKPQDLADQHQARQSFQGIHAPAILVVLDEACGIPDWLWEACLSLLTNERARILAIGNPDDGETFFGKVCQPGSQWHVIPVSAFDTPAFTGEAVPPVVAEGLVSRQWVKEAETDFGGKDNPLYQSKVLGKFPDRSDLHVITPTMVREAQARSLPGRGRGAFGLDVSRKGRDKTALYRVRDGVARLIDEWQGLPTPQTEGRVMAHVRESPAVPVVVDADGIGGGVYDHLVEADVLCVPFSVNGPARDSRRYANRRSEVWWEFRKMMQEGEIDLDPLDDILAAQLQSPRWAHDSRGRIRVETKEEMARRGVASPDRADAVIMPMMAEPMDLTEHGPLGERYPPERRPSRLPSATRVRAGEVAALRKAPM